MYIYDIFRIRVAVYGSICVLKYGCNGCSFHSALFRSNSVSRSYGRDVGIVLFQGYKHHSLLLKQISGITVLSVSTVFIIFFLYSFRKVQREMLIHITRVSEFPMCIVWHSNRGARTSAKVDTTRRRGIDLMKQEKRVEWLSILC